MDYCQNPAEPSSSPSDYRKGISSKNSKSVIEAGEINLEMEEKKENLETSISIDPPRIRRITINPLGKEKDNLIELTSKDYENMGFEQKTSI
jgi:hypothetical protein